MSGTIRLIITTLEMDGMIHPSISAHPAAIVTKYHVLPMWHFLNARYTPVPISLIYHPLNGASQMYPDPNLEITKSEERCFRLQ